jgi:hypothetical protein
MSSIRFEWDPKKAALNLLSTTLMIRLGRVYRGLMVDMQASNEKLRRRSLRMLMRLGGCDEAAARAALDVARGDLKRAILVLLDGVDEAEAGRRLAIELRVTETGADVRTRAGCRVEVVLAGKGLDDRLDLAERRRGGCRDRRGAMAERRRREQLKTPLLAEHPRDVEREAVVVIDAELGGRRQREVPRLRLDRADAAADDPIGALQGVLGGY